MKKFLILTTAIMVTGNTFAITLNPVACYLSTCKNQQTPDSTCDNTHSHEEKYGVEQEVVSCVHDGFKHLRHAHLAA